MYISFMRFQISQPKVVTCICKSMICFSFIFLGKYIDKNTTWPHIITIFFILYHSTGLYYIGNNTVYQIPRQSIAIIIQLIYDRERCQPYFQSIIHSKKSMKNHPSAYDVGGWWQYRFNDLKMKMKHMLSYV